MIAVADCDILSTFAVTTHRLTKFTCKTFKKIRKIKKFTCNFLGG